MIYIRLKQHPYWFVGEVLRTYQDGTSDVRLVAGPERFWQEVKNVNKEDIKITENR